MYYCKNGIANDILYPVAIHCWHTQNAHMTYISAQHVIENERPLEFSLYYYFTFDSVFYDFIHLVKVHVMRRLLMATMSRESASAGNSCLKWTLWVQAELELWVVRAFFLYVEEWEFKWKSERAWINNGFGMHNTSYTHTQFELMAN